MPEYAKNCSLRKPLFEESCILDVNPNGYGRFVSSGIATVISANATSGAVSIGLYEGGTGRFFLKSLSGGDGLAFVDGDDSTERSRITADGSLLVGAAAVEDWDGSRDHRIQVRGNTYQTAGISILDTQNDDNPCELLLGKSRGTGNTIVGSADDVGQLRWAANDGAGFHSIAWVRASMDGTPGSDDLPSNLRFGTSADGGTTVTERLRITSTGTVQPGADATQDLGSISKRWANIYSADLQLSNEGSENEVDGSWGTYTIQEGESDLFLINRRNGKKYKFNLTEVS